MPAEHVEWFAAASGADIEQGDLLDRVPFMWDAPSLVNVSAIDDLVEAEVLDISAIVLTHSCDLERRDGGDPSVKTVLLAPVRTKTSLAKDKYWGNRNIWNQSAKGQLMGAHILNESKLPGLELDFSYVDLYASFSLPYTVVEKLAEMQGPRLRLQTPFREALAQAFARCFMRIALPSPPLKF